MGTCHRVVVWIELPASLVFMQHQRPHPLASLLVVPDEIPLEYSVPVSVAVVHDLLLRGVEVDDVRHIGETSLPRQEPPSVSLRESLEPVR